MALSKTLNGSPKIYTFKRSTTGFPAIFSQALSAQKGLLQFTLGDLPQYTEFVNLYQFYRLKSVKVNFRPYTEVVNAPGSTASSPVVYAPRILTWVDYSGVTPSSTTFTDYQSYNSASLNVATKPFSRKFTPLPLTQIYNGVSSAYAISSSKQWLSTQYTGAAHYGLGYFLEATAGSSPNNLFGYALDVEYEFEFMYLK